MRLTLVAMFRIGYACSGLSLVRVFLCVISFWKFCRVWTCALVNRFA